MPRISETPPALKPFIFHGVRLEWRDNSQAKGDCPICGREGKFYVAIETGLWQCKVCSKSGNTTSFIRALYDLAREVPTDPVALASLVSNRGLLSGEVVMRWGAALSPLTDEWLLPGYNGGGHLVQLYRYSHALSGGKPILLATPTLHHGIFGPPSLGKEGTVVLVEGPWDGMALEEMLRAVKDLDGELSPTNNPEVSMAVQTRVLAVPGCNVWQANWSELLTGKLVVVCFDNDHARKHPKTGQYVAPTGYAGMRRVITSLAGAENPPSGAAYLHWGDQGYDPSLPSGYDLRDLLRAGGTTVASRIPVLRNILRERIRPVPVEWVPGREVGRPPGGLDRDCKSCNDWKTLIQAWRKAMKWTPGLDRALSVMLASITSTKSLGDQLWVKIIGPPSCGKSTLCEALTMCSRYVKAKSTIRGFHSGFRVGDAERDKEDNSLIAEVMDKTLVTKDGDTLLQSPNLPQILSEARDLYDCTTRSHYRNRMGKDYPHVRMTWILCGTAALLSVDLAELGERFLTSIIMESIDDDLEDEILWRKANQADREVNLLADGKKETQHTPELFLAMALTGGYVNYLRSNAQQLIEQVELGEAAKMTLIRLGKFVSFMRARPSRKQDEHAERELAARLVSQHVRLAKCMAVVLNRSKVDVEVMIRVQQVAMDTARGPVLNLTRLLAQHGTVGLELTGLSIITGENHLEENKRLKFMRKIGAVETHEIKPGKKRWRLTTRMMKLYHEAVEGTPYSAPLETI